MAIDCFVRCLYGFETCTRHNYVRWQIQMIHTSQTQEATCEIDGNSSTTRYTHVLHTERDWLRRYAPCTGSVKETVSSLSVCPFSRNNSAFTRQIFMKFDIFRYLENLHRKIQVSLKSDNNNGWILCVLDLHHLDIWIKVDQLDDTCFIIYCSTCFRR